MRISIFFTLLCLSFHGLCFAQSLPDKGSPPKVEVHLSIPKRTYKLGEAVELTAFVKNIGSEPFYVWKGISFAYYGEGLLATHLTDSTGQEVPPKVAFGSHAYFAGKSDFADYVEKEWLLLVPGQFYGVTTQNWFSAGLPAGRYSLVVEYSSSAFPWVFAGRSTDDLWKSAARLKYPALLGEFNSNEVTFEVAKR
jgi:hypothetical protein